MNTSKYVLRFDGWTFDPDTLELRRGRDPVPLPPTASRVLATLLSRRGGLATRAELRAAVWPGATAAADQSLNTSIKQIRAALGDDARAPRYIATVHRRGYRMVPAVEEGIDGEFAGRRLRVPPLSPWSRRAALVAGLGAVFLAGQRSATGPATIDGVSPAPQVHFEVLGTSDDLQGIDDRLSEAIGKHLTANGAYWGQRSQSAGVVITGVVSPAPDGADLRARIVRASDGATLWTGSFNPLCPDARGDPVEIIGRYLARTVSEVHRI